MPVLIFTLFWGRLLTARSFPCVHFFSSGSHFPFFLFISVLISSLHRRLQYVHSINWLLLRFSLHRFLFSRLLWARFFLHADFRQTVSLSTDLLTRCYFFFIIFFSFSYIITLSAAVWSFPCTDAPRESRIFIFTITVKKAIEVPRLQILLFLLALLPTCTNFLAGKTKVDIIRKSLGRDSFSRLKFVPHLY